MKVAKKSAQKLHMSVNWRLITVFIVSTAIIVTIVLYFSSHREGRSNLQNPVPAFTTTPITVTNDVPIYPNLLERMSWTCLDLTPSRCGYGAYTEDTPEQVAAYYIEQLERQGWVVQQHVLSAERPSSYLRLVWVNTELGPPARRLFTLNSGKAAEGDSNTVSVSVLLWPDPNMVPLYPNTIEPASQWNTATHERVSKITTYSAFTTSAEILKYYDEVLTQFGWLKALENEYVFSYGKHESYTWSTIIIELDEQSNGIVKVKIVITGTELAK